jgi:hypothetical protein
MASPLGWALWSFWTIDTRILEEHYKKVTIKILLLGILFRVKLQKKTKLNRYISVPEECRLLKNKRDNASLLGLISHKSSTKHKMRPHVLNTSRVISVLNGQIGNLLTMRYLIMNVRTKGNTSKPV